MPKVYLTESDKLQAIQENKDRYFRAIVEKNIVLYGISKKQIALKFGFTIRHINDMIKNPHQIKKHGLSLMFSILRFTDEEIINSI